MTQSEAGPTAADSLTEVMHLVHSVVRRARRYWPVLLIFVLLGPVAFLVAPRVYAPLYKSETVLMIREGVQAEVVLGSESGSAESRRTRNARLSEQLLSRPNLRAVVEQENVYPSTVARLGMTDAVEELRKNIKFTAGEGNTITIQFEDGRPDMAQRVTRRLAQTLVQQVGRDTERRAESTRKFLESELNKSASELRTREEEYAQFLALHPEFALERTQPQGAGASVRAAARTADASEPAAALRRQAERLRRRLAQLKNPQAVVEPEPAAPAPTPQLAPESREAIAAAEREVGRARDELESRQAQYTPLHPDVVAAKSRLSGAQERLARIRAAAQELAVTPRRSAGLELFSPGRSESPQELERQLRSIEGSIAVNAGSAKPGQAVPSSVGSAAAIVSLETQWAALGRDLGSARERYEAIQRRLFQAVIVATAQTSGGGTQVVVVDEAYLPRRPSRRGPMRTGAVAALVVLMLGGFVTFGLGYLDQRVSTEWDVSRLGIGPIAMVVPSARRKLPGRSARD
jgi:capsular polysaccharide biosynthesis protein